MDLVEKKTEVIDDAELFGTPLTAEDLVTEYSLQMAVQEPRYGGGRFVVMFGNACCGFYEMFDAMTDGGDNCQHIENMTLGTPWYPVGYGNTIVEAMNAAVARTNTLTLRERGEGLRLVHNSPGEFKGDEQFTPMEPLVIDPANL